MKAVRILWNEAQPTCVKDRLMGALQLTADASKGSTFLAWD